MNITTDRRSFIHATSVTVLTAAAYSRVLGANDRVALGLIGYGLIGKTHTATFSKIPACQIVGVADCHRKRADQGVTAVGGGATAYQDFRKLLDCKDVQAVIVATPDHWHALMGMMACAAGKDVYIEKPLTLFVGEGEWLQKIADRTKRVVQVGTQQRSGLHYQKARELIRSGHLGTISSVRMDAIRNVSPGFGNPADGEPPVGMDYNSWLGPAPLRKYNPNRGLYHFRWFWDYAGGMMTDWGVHVLDIAQMAFNELSPRSITSVGGKYMIKDNRETPDTLQVTYEYPNGMIATYENRMFNGNALYGGALAGRSYGTVFHGDKGTLFVDRASYVILPEKGSSLTETVVQSSNNHGRDHWRNFLDCIKSRQKPASDIENGHRSTSTALLGNIALRTGLRLDWNAEKETLAQAPARPYLERKYTKPWELKV